MKKNGRNRVQEAALKLFATCGIDATTTRQIAECAGLAEGTLYRHFRTKDDLAIALFVDLAGRLVARLDAAVAKTSTSEEAVTGIVEEFFLFFDTEPHAYDFITHQHPPLRALGDVRLPKDVVLAAIRRGMDAGVFRKMDPLLATAMVVGVITRVLFFERQGLLRGSRDEVARAALRILKEAP